MIINDEVKFKARSSSLVIHISKILSFAWKTWICSLYNFLECCLLLKKKKSSLCNPFSYLHKRSRNIHILKRQLVIIGIHSFWKLNFLFFLKCNTKKKMRRMQNIKIILKDNIMAELDYHFFYYITCILLWVIRNT